MVELESELQELDDKYRSVQELIQERQRQLKKKSFPSADREPFASPDLPGGRTALNAEDYEKDIANKKRYAQLLNDLDQAKLDILKLKEDQVRAKAQAQRMQYQK